VSKHLNKVYLLLGSNMDNPARQLDKATSLISDLIGFVSRKSSVYRTAAWGNTQQADFLNSVLIVQTSMAPEALLQTILEIEQKMGRKRTVKNAPRKIDIDILFYNKSIIKQLDLIIPHPLIQERRFVLTPLNELSPQFKHPVNGQTIHTLLKKCTDTLDVQRIS
jgi:2-amino-4-hydroxy-6-hydroxymethyldihydropteridine diphosphokinase